MMEGRILLNSRADPIPRRLRAALDEIYGDRLERVVLYGSRARGEERPDSDYDIAVFIKEPGRFGDELHRLASITTDILLDTDAVISALPFRAGGIRSGRASCTSCATTGSICEPETADYLVRARRRLADAKTITAAELLDVAAREAYLAAYRAASPGLCDGTRAAPRRPPRRVHRSQIARLGLRE